ncbi:fimbrial protein [Paraburkholderia sp. MMS20-SJTR3]|uniref:Fimbrial protein n=1 Tax=Paraburkholderia sejongensis TaxID=2886946 RepID=A0ABS8JNM5_9BURK|nr:fimbrial protein [Paraburkholderia sp. MMS20-SJTR3]MCC8391508.1 fimbrial protein [Paraburkholderia sp. MMS20-SJTR3]
MSRLNGLWRRGARRCFAVLLMIAGGALPAAAWAATGCYKITGRTTSTTSGYYTDAGLVVGSWSGSTDSSGANAYPMTVNVNTPPFVPDGTLLGSGVSALYNLGANGVGSYSPEQVLFRCSADAAGTMYEYFATNGDSPHAGGTDISGASGIPGTYTSYYKGTISRVTNVTTGQYVTRYWQARALTGLDTDSQGWFLIKAKNFSQYRLELFQCSACSGGSSSGTGKWGQSQPMAYVAFKGGASGNLISSGLSVGADSNSQYSGWYGSWPGSINPYGNVIVRRAATCAVRNTTPTILFPTMTISRLQAGESVQRPITIQVECQSSAPSGLSSFVSGTAASQTALGILAAPGNAQSATSEGLTTSGTGVTYLLSDGYGSDPGVATGVGVALSRPGGGALNLLTNQYVTTGGAADGWDPVLNDATQTGSSSTTRTYTRNIMATFKAFRSTVTAGRYNATAQVIVRVQ